MRIVKRDKIKDVTPISAFFDNTLNEDFIQYHHAIIEKGGMNVEVAHENLVKYLVLAEKFNVRSWLCFGTLLGIVRDGDLIPYDTDVDIAVLDDDMPNIITMLNSDELKRSGFYVGRVYDNDSPHVISLFRKSEYVDLYTFYNADGYKWCNDGVPVHPMIRNEQFGNSKIGDYPILDDAEELLLKWYGEDWNIPKNTKF